LSPRSHWVRGHPVRCGPSRPAQPDSYLWRVFTTVRSESVRHFTVLPFGRAFTARSGQDARGPSGTWARYPFPSGSAPTSRVSAFPNIETRVSDASPTCRSGTTMGSDREPRGPISEWTQTSAFLRSRGTANLSGRGQCRDDLPPFFRSTMRSTRFSITRRERRLFAPWLLLRWGQ
jgi:hypothetical protein